MTGRDLVIAPLKGFVASILMMDMTNEETTAFLDDLIERVTHPTLIDRLLTPYYRVCAWRDMGVFDLKHYDQRLRYGVSYRDVWGLDYHLASIIERGVRQLRAKGYGHPGSLTFEEWQAILAEIEEGMRLKQTNPGFQSSDWDKVDWALDLLRRYFHHLWDYIERGPGGPAPDKRTGLAAVFRTRCKVILIEEAGR